MKIFLKKSLSMLCLFIILVAYIARIVWVNHNNELTKINYLSDNESVNFNGCLLSVKEKTLYDIAAFVAEYPQIAKYYRYAGSVYEASGDEQWLPGIEHELVVKINIKNISDKTVGIPIFPIICGNTYNNSIQPELFSDINSNLYEIAPGKNMDVLFPYELHRLNFREENYNNLAGQKFSISISGYPDIRYIALTDVKERKAKKQEIADYQKLISPKGGTNTPIIEDTPRNTIMELGGSYIKNGCKLEIEDCTVLRNIKNYKGYDPSAFTFHSSKDIILDDGIVAPYKDLDGTVQKGETYLVFIKVKCTNVSEVTKNLSIYPYLFNGAGNDYCESCYEKTWEENRAGRKMDAGETRHITLGYYVALRLNKWKLPDAPLYLEFTGMNVENADMVKGKADGGIFLQVQ
ncbi:hypothetical protein D7V86_19130 [bacterium D16-51]|nr:hypothetical protein D7V96_06255 [bacterium D16-59]RKI56703.1 hypothetical protein D7V86_19130 [bacterium D16-51]